MLKESFQGEVGECQLSYQFIANPSPLRINDRADLHVIINNNSKQKIYCQSIALFLPLGSDTQCLTSETQISAQLRQGNDEWVVANITESEPGICVLKPKKESEKGLLIDSKGIELVLTDITVNAKVGCCEIKIFETLIDSKTGKCIKNEGMQEIVKWAGKV